MTNEARKVCIVVNSRANYGRIKSVLQAVREHPQLKLQLVVGASALLQRFGNVREVMERDGFTPDATVYTIVEGETPTTMAKSTGLGILELATIFENIRPDVVLTVADRFETIATAIAACYMNICLAHTQGGEVTGSIDESVRHAVTKLAHLHFPATRQAASYVERMGEDPSRVFLTGCPSIDAIASIDLSLPRHILAGSSGVGAPLDPNKPYVVVLQHPVTTEFGSGEAQITETIEAVAALGMQAIWLWPNVDAGSDEVSKGLRRYRESHNPDWLRLHRSFPVEDYARLIKNAACLIGNSSSALREGAFLGVPAVNIGTRQNGRECHENVTHAGYSRNEILAAAKKQIAHGPYRSSNMFGDGQAGRRIAETLAVAPLTVQKQLHYAIADAQRTA
ncbi:MAG: UDP-N-acetylglucosamine 2-epimerase (hydrolyzing) [Pseudorhodoplanes sp.]|nr:UDP-N-acetylglucosamine 2-epimerase (hydrolyzing) [Pseudorhodoplanes sp.]MCQ3943407.1 UDP-N-acetylglucosamine 2-epimerase (hydrolyzing) [Alphaproteobacteria bacterium]GIK79328.1 MAG: UDP-N-acetyl glucosamine 2-epimerase [Alphaproteobacteria bacterium]